MGPPYGKLPILFPYHSHVRIPIDMGIVWEDYPYHKGVPCPWGSLESPLTSGLVDTWIPLIRIGSWNITSNGPSVSSIGPFGHSSRKNKMSNLTFIKPICSRYNIIYCILFIIYIYIYLLIYHKKINSPIKCLGILCTANMFLQQT